MSIKYQLRITIIFTCLFICCAINPVFAITDINPPATVVRSDLVLQNGIFFAGGIPYTGKGTFIYTDGARYDGDFVSGKFNGKGVYSWVSGERYAGDYVDGKRNGKGIFTWADGARYEGDYVDGKRTGKGIFTWPNGNRYEGDYVDSKREGYGILYFRDGTTQSGRWSNDKYVGPSDTRLQAPQQISPQSGTIFNVGYPRTTYFKWTEVEGASHYCLEIEPASPSQATRTWEWDGVKYAWWSEIIPDFKYRCTKTAQPEFVRGWVGAQPGRWRVYAVDAEGNESDKSPWWLFRYIY